VPNVSELLRCTVLKYPENGAITYHGKTIAWKTVFERSYCIRERLLGLGVGRGDVVAVYTEHAPCQAIGLFGISMASAIFTIINTNLKEDQVLHQIADSDVRVVIGTQVYIDANRHLWEERQIPVILIEPDGSVEDCKEIQVDFEFVLSNNINKDVSNIIYTSGSTGKAKGVVVPNQTLLDGARIVCDYLSITKEDVLLSILPLSFDYGLNQLMTVVSVGARIVFHEFGLPQDLLNVLDEEQITGFAAVPTLWPNMFNPKLVDIENKSKFNSLRFITTAGGMHTEEILKKLVSFFPTTEIIIMYGLTESFRSTYLPHSEVLKRIGSIGKPVPEVEILVLNDKGFKCKPGEMGELIHRGAFVTYGYLNNPSLNDSKFIRLHTGGPGCLPEIGVRSGDIVSLDEEGFIYIHGRLDMQIKCSGYRISPDEVEEVAQSFDPISQAAVFGRKDKATGQSVNLAYTTYGNRNAEQGELKRFLISDLPNYAIPKYFKHYESLPSTTSGKIDYQILKDDFSNEFGCDD